MPHGNMRIFVGLGEVLERITFEEGQRQLEVILEEPLILWSGARGVTFQLMEASLLLSNERTTGLLLDMNRAAFPGDSPVGDWALLASGDSLQLVLQNPEAGSAASPGTFRGFARLDRRFLGGWIDRRVTAWEDKHYAAVRRVHRMGLREPEEDDMVLYYSCASGYWITKMPYMGDLDFYHMNDWPERKRRRINDFYRECVRRQLYLNGPEKTHLAKNPLWAGRVASLVEAFPDARFVVNVRDPRDTIPSLLSLVRAGWKQLGWEEARQQRCLRILADQSWHSYRHPLETVEAHPETKSAVVDYRDLTHDPAATIERVYQDLGLPITDAFREVLAGEGKREQKHRTGHRYSLEEFGLEGDAIRERLGDLFERFQWEA